MHRRQRAAIAITLGLITVGAAGLAGQYWPCAGYRDWQTSPYVLPYPAGETYAVYQANCTLGGHHGVYRYSYDFLMPIGSPVTAARAGVVAETREGFADGEPFENLVKIRHSDDTLAAYSHLHSVLVKMGDRVAAGDLIGLSGNTGQTGGVPHLHFHVSTCSEPVECGTLPVTFRNTDSNPAGLEASRRYPAR